MTDRLYFGGFVNTGPDTFASPNWLGQGVIGAILHELGHLNINGFNNWNTEKTQLSIENAAHKNGGVNFYNTDYGADNEYYAHQYAKAVASTLKLPFDQFDKYAVYNQPFKGAHQIYLEHKGDNGWNH